MENVNFVEANKRFWQKYVEPNGTATRAEYWWAFFGIMIVSIVLSILDTVIFGSSSNDFGYGVLGGIWILITFIPGIMVHIRRMHDIGKSGWNILWWLLPLVGWVIGLVHLCTSSKFENNPYRKV